VRFGRKKGMGNFGGVGGKEGGKARGESKPVGGGGMIKR